MQIEERLLAYLTQKALLGGGRVDMHRPSPHAGKEGGGSSSNGDGMGMQGQGWDDATEDFEDSRPQPPPRWDDATEDFEDSPPQPPPCPPRWDDATGDFEESPPQPPPCPPSVRDVPFTRLVLPQGRRKLRRLPPGCTTLVVRNVPNNITLQDLLASWGLDGSFNYLFYPYNMKSKRRLGFVFLNFVSPQAAVRFQSKWQGADLLPVNKKKLDIAAATQQGLQANLEVFRGKRSELMRDPDLLPVILIGTRRVDTLSILMELGIIDGARKP